MMKNNKLNIIIAVGLILMAGTARILNHEMQWYNIAPVAALGLFSGAVIKDKKYAFLLPILALFMGDIYMAGFTTWKGFYGISQIFVYAGIALVTLLGTQMGKPKALKVLGYSISGSVVFFIVSNFGVWMQYGHGFQGLISTYVMGIPFFRNSLAGDLVGSVLLFGAYYLLQQALSAKMQKAKA